MARIHIVLQRHEGGGNPEVLELASVVDDRSAALQPNGQMVICNNQITAKDTTECDLVVKSSVLQYNGDDGLDLIVDGVLVDRFGTGGSKEKFTVCGTVDAGKDRTLVRKSDVCQGNVADLGSFAEDKCEWVIYSKDQATYFNVHIANCGTFLFMSRGILSREGRCEVVAADRIFLLYRGFFYRFFYPFFVLSC